MHKVLLFFISCLIIAATTVVSAQEIQELQKAIRNDLNKHAPAASGVSFEGCKMTIKISSGGWVTVHKDQVGLTELNDMKPKVIAPTRPGEEAAGYLSAGAGEDHSTVETDRFLIDFAAIKPDRIGAGTRRTEGSLPLGIVSSEKWDAISMKERGKVKGLPLLSFWVKADAAPRVAAAMQELSRRCLPAAN